jgi:hypothetical protein
MCVLAVVSVDRSMYHEVLTAVQALTGTHGRKGDRGNERLLLFIDNTQLKQMKNDVLAQALAAFLDAMFRYRQRYEAEFAVQYI